MSFAAEQTTRAARSMPDGYQSLLHQRFNRGAEHRAVPYNHTGGGASRVRLFLRFKVGHEDNVGGTGDSARLLDRKGPFHMLR